MFTAWKAGVRVCVLHRGNVISSERDDRLGSLEVSAVAVTRNLRSTVRLRTTRTDRVGDRGTPEVEGQVKGSAESLTGRVWTLTISLFQEMFQHLSQRSRNVWTLYRSFRRNASLSAVRNRSIDDFASVEIFKMFERDGNSFISTDVLRLKTNWCEKFTDEEVDVMIRKADTDHVGEFVVSQRSARVHCTCTKFLQDTRCCFQFLIISVSYVFSQEQFTMSRDPWCGLQSATRLGWIRCRMIASRGSSVKTELTSCSKEFSHQDQDQMQHSETHGKNSQQHQQQQPRSSESGASSWKQVRTGDQDESRNKVDVLASEAASSRKLVRTDNEAMKISEKS